jgi:hypothetical protein
MSTYPSTSRLAAALLGSIATTVIALASSGPALALKTHLAIEPPLGPFYAVEALAVDQATGNLYVAVNNAEEYNHIHVFGPTGGAPIGGAPPIFGGENTPNGGFNSIGGIAIGGGDAYVSDHGDPALASERDSLAVFKFKLQGAHESDEYLSQRTNTETIQAGPVAVDALGDVYIGYSLGNSPGVYEFGPAGEEIGVFQSGGLNAPGSIAVAADGTLYAANQDNGLLLVEFKRSSPTGTVEGSPEVIASGVSGVAFDQASGHLLIDKESVVEELGSSNEVIESFGEGVLTDAAGIAVDEGTGDVYVLNNTGQRGLFMETVQRFGPAVLLADVTTGASKEVEYTTATVEGTVDPDGTRAEYDFQYRTGTGPWLSTAPVVAEGETSIPVSAHLSGLQASSIYHYRLVARNNGGVNEGGEESFTTLTAVEGVVTGEASDVTSTTATLNGQLSPGSTEAHYYFEYGTSEAYGSKTPLTLAGAGSEVPASASVSGLRGNTRYYYRLVAENEHGATPGEPHSLLTPASKPAVLAQSASRIFPREALLSAVVNPDGASTTYHFVYGTTPGYGSRAPLHDLALTGSGEQLQALLTVTGLQPGTTYHYAVVATGPGGTTVGPDETLTTPVASLPAVVTGPVSEVSQNAATLSGSIDPEGVPTSYEIDVGTDTTYASRIYGEAGSGTEPVTIATSVQGLAPGTLYHYRLVATNTYGTVYGADETFTTPGFPTALLLAPVSAPLIPAPEFAPPPSSGGVTNGAALGKPKHKTRKAKHRKKVAKRARKTGGARRARGGRRGRR